MKIWYSKYQLYPIGTLNSKSKTQFRQGALLRVRYDDGTVGYSDLCPFSEMGDRPLDSELKSLETFKPSRLGKNSLRMNKLDAEARAEQRSLYDVHSKIKNHFLVSDIVRFDPNRIEQLEAMGYSEFKVKLGRDLSAETEKLKAFVEKLGSRSKFRLDFNCALSAERFTHWFELQQKWLRPSLDFVEDPFPYDGNEWRSVSQKWGVVLALDQAADAVKSGAEGAQVIVIKPAIHDEQAIVSRFRDTNKKFVFTHYMDFPVGQMFALVAAQRAQWLAPEQYLTCGLQHHDIYEGFAFQDAVKYDGPLILPPDGLGIGFDSLLSSASWLEL